MARKNLIGLRATGRVTRMNLTKEFPQEMVKKLTPAFKSAAKIMEKEAKRRVPVDTGTLKASISSKVLIGSLAKTKKMTGGVKVPISVELKATAPYAAFVEYGTGRVGSSTYVVRGQTPAGFIQKPVDYSHGVSRGRRAQPYIRPAMVKAIKAMQLGRL